MSYIAKNGRLYTSGASEALTLLDDKFSVNKSYSKGDSCIYNDYLWKFTSNKPAGEWDSSVVEQCRIMDFVDDANGRLMQVQTQIVPDASIESGAFASRAYNVGEYLVKNGSLWKATTNIAEGDALSLARIAPVTVSGELMKMPQSQYKIKEYAFEYTQASSWIDYDIDESNAFLDGSGYLDSTNEARLPARFPLNYSADNHCLIVDIDGATKLRFWSKHAGTIHAFIRYK